MDPNDHKPPKKSVERNQEDCELIFGCGTDTITIPADFVQDIQINMEANETVTIEQRSVRIRGTNTPSSSNQPAQPQKTEKGQDKENIKKEDGPITRSHATQPSTHALKEPEGSPSTSEGPRQIEVLRAANAKVPNAVVCSDGVRLVCTHPPWYSNISPPNRPYNPYMMTYARRPTNFGINPPANGFFVNNNIMAQNMSVNPNFPPRLMPRFPSQMTYPYPRPFYGPSTSRKINVATQTSEANGIVDSASHVRNAVEHATPSISMVCAPMRFQVPPTHDLPPVSTVRSGLPDSTATNSLSVADSQDRSEQPNTTVVVRPIPSTSNTTTAGSNKRSSAECSAVSSSNKSPRVNLNAVSSSDQRQRNANPQWIALDMVEINHRPRNEIEGNLVDYYQMQVNAFSRMNDNIQSGAGIDFRNFFPELPLTAVSDIRRFDDSVRNRRVYLITYLTLVGGDTVWEVVGRVLTRLMHASVLAGCTWLDNSSRDYRLLPARPRQGNLLDLNTTAIAQYMRLAVLYMMPGNSMADIDFAFYCHTFLAISTAGRVHTVQQPRNNRTGNNQSESGDDNRNNSQEDRQNNSNGNNM